ncbi:hypothetical protein [Bradyrhizobium sp. LTSP849]|uniref:hypothetical protein n=1 Tax=Bradyrhizobium sp. LTSP849 TaxID=1615890 RepID=UPI0012E03E7A|nr:hypothetical protein [Bradyrhizobium sp. LTSP849]
MQTVITAAFGTFVGAFVTSRSQAKRRTIDELKAVHVAYGLCFTMINKALAIKRQHIRPMKQAYDEAVERYDDFAANPAGAFALELDLRTLSQVRFGVPALEKVVFEKFSLGHRGIAAAASLADATEDLRISIDYRNSLISEFQKRQPTTHLERIAFYVGAYMDEQVDLRFGHNLEALSLQADDCIFFGMKLADELLRLERKLHSRNGWKYRLNIPRQHPADWSTAHAENLIPTQDRYADWLRGFGKPPTVWGRLKNYLARLKRPSEQQV